MNILLSLSLVLCVPALADLQLRYLMTTTVDRGNAIYSSNELFMKGRQMRMEFTSAVIPGKSWILANRSGVFSCQEARKACVKMNYKSGFFSIFSLGSSVRTKRLKLTDKATVRKVGGFRCRDYEVDRMTTVEGSSGESAYVETNCYSESLLKMVPSEMLADAKNEISSGTDAPDIKRAGLAEIALGIPVQRRAKVTTTGATPPSNDVTITDMKLVSAKETKLPDSLFYTPKGYQIMESERFNSSIENIKKQGNQKLRKALPPEALEQLRKLKASGKFTPEMEKQFDEMMQD